MSERESILARIKEALSVMAPLPGHEAARPHPVLDSEPAHNVRAWLPSVGASFAERLALFRQHAADLKADFHLLESWQEVCSALLAQAKAERWTNIGTHAGELTDAAARALGLPVCQTDLPYAVAALESCDAGLTECDALVAQTGSVLVTSRSAGGRALSVLPPHHVVLARRSQLLADLSDAFGLLKEKYESHYPSFISLITGPSRTGDIERVLVLGAHGPRKLTIYCF